MKVIYEPLLTQCVSGYYGSELQGGGGMYGCGVRKVGQDVKSKRDDQ